jgi:PTS system cellobiose-specific IIA component
MSNNYEVIFNIILHAGNANSKYLLAIEDARMEKFDDALKNFNEAEEELHLAHRSQTAMVQDEARGKKVELSLLLVHAQDHLTMATTSKVQAEEFIHLYKVIHTLKERIQ